MRYHSLYRKHLIVGFISTLHEYGMECWEYEEFKYHPISTEKLDTSKVKTFVGGCWSTLSDIIERGKDNE